MAEYFSKIISLRYFLFHMAIYDLKQKYRGSFLGALWALLLPFGMACLLSLVLSSVFNQDVTEYLPYVFSGIVIWEFVTTIASGGCHVFRFSQYYIRQNNLPSMVYTLRYTTAALINFLLGLVALLTWVLITNFTVLSLSWLVLPFSVLALFLVMWPLATMNAFISTWLNDYAQLMTLVMQALFFVSPVFLKSEVFLQSKYNLGFLINYNPVYHALELFRAPLLRGELPALENWIFTLGFAAIIWIITLFIVKRSEKNLIFYF